MKKLFVVAIALIASINCFSQEFMGVKVDGKKNEVINSFKNKGFTINGDPNGDGVIMKGFVNGKNYELIISSTPVTKTVWKISVFLPEKTTWSSLKNEYFEYVELLTNKYGNPEDTFAFFSSPYYEGDGYELSAVRLEKSHFSAFWSDEKGVSVQISKYKQVKVSYENPVNSKLLDKEKLEANSKIF